MILRLIIDNFSASRKCKNHKNEENDFYLAVKFYKKEQTIVFTYKSKQYDRH